jgi:ATP-dependent protease ClpP protease subunit
VREDTDRDFILSAEDAKVYGLVDEVVTDRKLRVAAAAVNA